MFNNSLISVILITHSPDKIQLEKALNSLKSQNLSQEKWELLLIDHGTPNRTYLQNIDLSWHPFSGIIREEKMDLIWAKIAGIKASQGSYLLLIDDQNALAENYLTEILQIFQTYPQLGAIGGKSLPVFESKPPEWIWQFWDSLGLRDLGETPLIYELQSQKNLQEYARFLPINMGMVVRKKALSSYVHRVLIQGSIPSKSLRQTSLRGGDYDLILTLLQERWSMGYFPQLQLTHFIPSYCLTKEYLAHLNYVHSCVQTQVLDFHGFLNDQKIPTWTIPFHKIQTFWQYQPWQNHVSYIRWKGACGIFDGLINQTKMKKC